jgi:hypothetical protein
MELNAILFPAPKSSYHLKDLENCLFIPRKSYGKKNQQIEKKI